MIWILLAVIALVYDALTYAFRIPYRFNFRIRSQMKMLNVSIKILSHDEGDENRHSIILFLHHLCHGANGKGCKLGLWFLPVFLFIIVGTMGFYLIRGYRLK